MKILLVEDEVIARETVRDILELSDHKVLEAGNGEEALHHYRQSRPDLIITDLQMPVMDGAAIIRNIRQNDPRIRIIVISADTETGRTKTAEELGIDGYLRKPVNIRQLHEILDNPSL